MGIKSLISTASRSAIYSYSSAAFKLPAGSRAPHWWRLCDSDLSRESGLSYSAYKHQRTLCCVDSRDQTSPPIAVGRQVATRWNGRRCLTAESMRPLDSRDSWRTHTRLLEDAYSIDERSRIAFNCVSYSDPTDAQAGVLDPNAQLEKRMRLHLQMNLQRYFCRLSTHCLQTDTRVSRLQHFSFCFIIDHWF